MYPHSIFSPACHVQIPLFFLFCIIIILRSQVHLNLSGELITFTVDTGCKFSYDIISE